MRRFRFLTLLLLALFLMLQGAPASAQSKTIVWERFDVTLGIHPNGSVTVVERQRIRFSSGTFTFGFRTIPLAKTEGIVDVRVSEPGGSAYRLASSGGEPHTFTAVVEGSDLSIRWYFPEVGNASRTYDIEYTVLGGVRIYDSGDKFQWISQPTDRDFPIEASSVIVALPSGASFLDIDSAGVPVTWQQTGDGRFVTYTSTGSLGNSGIIEIGVEFTHGVLTAPSPGWQADHDKDEFYALKVQPFVNLGVGLVAALVLIGGPLLVYLLWYTRGRDPKVGPVPEYITEPPDDTPPGVLGTLIDERADMRDIIATIVDLGRRGHLAIEEEQSKGIFGLSSHDFTFRKGDEADTELSRVERQVIQGIFGSGRVTRLTDMKNKFYTHLPKIQKRLYEEMVKRSFFKTNPDTTRRRWQILGIGSLAGTFFVGLFALPMLIGFSQFVPCVFVGFGITGLAMLLLGRAMPAKTRKGSEMAAKWRAFKKYLSRIEQHEELDKSTELFDRYLPYAIAFGIKDTWIFKFSSNPATPIPPWYYPYGMWGGSRRGSMIPTAARGGSSPSGGLQQMSDGLSGSLQNMSDGLSRLLNSAGSVMRSAPSSSGSSGGGGFSGGGFSGGGGGGGGGGGFG
jgi:uncharacterized membrane protein YgcG